MTCFRHHAKNSLKDTSPSRVVSSSSTSLRDSIRGALGCSAADPQLRRWLLQLALQSQQGQGPLQLLEKGRRRRPRRRDSRERESDAHVWDMLCSLLFASFFQDSSV